MVRTLLDLGRQYRHVETLLGIALLGFQSEIFDVDEATVKAAVRCGKL